MLERIESAEIAYLSGRTQEALSILIGIVAEDDQNLRALCSLGVIYHALGQYDDAKNCFMKILAADRDNLEANVNLILTYISQEDFLAAKDFLDDSLSRNDANFIYWNLLSKVEASLDNFSSSIACARRSLSINPDQAELSVNPGSLDSNKIMFEYMFQKHAESEKKKMSFFLNGGANPEIEVLSERLSKYFSVEKVMSFKYDVYQKAASDADIIWIEGLSNNSVYFLNDKEYLKGKMVVVRLSREDVLAGAAKKVSFAEAGLVILESYYLRDLFLQDNPILKDENVLQVFTKAVDTRHFNFTPKFGSKRICSIIPRNFEMAEFIYLLEAFLVINRKFPDTELHLDCGLRNINNDIHANQFLLENGIGYKVHFHSYGNELKNFLADNHYILSAETFSGGPGIVEALMLGLKPLIHSSPGAIELYPENCLWRNLSELIPLYENPPDTIKISQCLMDIHDPKAVVTQYIQKFITLKWS
jgi:tetratricopeptide (TPR) repeat protein